MCLRINPIFVTSELSSQPIDLENNRLGQHKDFCTTLGWQEQNFKACSIGIESFGFWRKRGKNTKRVSFETKTKAFTRNDLLFFLAHLELVVDPLSHRYGMDVIAVSHALACPIVQQNPLVCAGKIDWQMEKMQKFWRLQNCSGSLPKELSIVFRLFEKCPLFEWLPILAGMRDVKNWAFCSMSCEWVPTSGTWPSETTRITSP